MTDYGRGSLSRSKSESNLADRALQRIARSKSLGDVQYSSALDLQMRDHIRELRRDLNQKRFHVAGLKRENVARVRAAREEEISESVSFQNDLVFKVLLDKDKEIKQLEDQARKYTNEKLDELERKKNEELRRTRKDFEYEKEVLINTLAARFRDEARNEVEGDFEKARRNMDQDYYTLLSENMRLREDLKTMKESDEEKAEEIRKMHDENSKKMAGLKRDASQDSRRQLAEMKEMQKVIEQLERKLGLESGSCLRLQMEKESLDEALSRLKLADSWDKRASKSNIRGFGDIDFEASFATCYPSRRVSRNHYQPDRALQRKVLEMTSLIRRIDESNQNLAARNQELINEIENMRNDRDPLQQKAKRLGAKNMELVQANRRQEDRITNQQDEILSLRERLKTYEELIARKDKELSKLRTKAKVKNDAEIQKEEVETLQTAVQEQLQIIYELRQQAVEKDRRIDVLRERMQKKQAKRNRKANGRKSTSPDSLNSVSMEEDSLSSTSENIADPHMEDLDSSFNDNESSRQEKESYTKLMKDHMELERAYGLLQKQAGGHLDPERTQLHIDAVQSDLLVAQARIHDLETQLEEANAQSYTTIYQAPQIYADDFKEERAKLRSANKTVHEKLISAESEVVTKTMEIKRLTQDLMDVEEQRDLLEFRIAELEEKSRAKSPEIESSQLTDDDKLNLSQEMDEVECDQISVRIALKELEINKEAVLSKREKRALVQAITLVDKEEKEIRSLEATEKQLTKRVNELEGKYNTMKIKFSEKENELSSVLGEKARCEEKQLISTDDIFEDGDIQYQNNNTLEMNEHPRELLAKAQQRIAEMELANCTLQQQIDRYENEKKQALSEHDLEILKQKVDELDEVRNRLNKVMDINEELESRIEDLLLQKKASDLIGDVVNGIPNTIASEIESLNEERRLLTEELEFLRARSKESFTFDERVKKYFEKEDRSTQTAATDDTPWHKYMSPRSERSLSRNDSGLTSRLLTDEGTQTPRIHDFEERSDRLAFEEHVTSAPSVQGKLDIDFGMLPALEDKVVVDITEPCNEAGMDQLSSESLFQFADRLLQEATYQAKEVMKEEFYTTFSTTLRWSADDTLSPFDIDDGLGPGEIIDLYIERYDSRDKVVCNEKNPADFERMDTETRPCYGGRDKIASIEEIQSDMDKVQSPCKLVTKEGVVPGKIRAEDDVYSHRHPNSKPDAVVETKPVYPTELCNGFEDRSSLTLLLEKYNQPQQQINSLEFDPLQIETSSVDENSYMKQPSPEENNHFSTILKTKRIMELPQTNFNEDSSKTNPTKSMLQEHERQYDQGIDHEDFEPSMNGASPNSFDTNTLGCQFESSQSVATEDLAGLLEYGETLREQHGGGYSLSNSVIEEPSAEIVHVNYDESFTVENNGSSIDSQDMALGEDAKYSKNLIQDGALDTELAKSALKDNDTSLQSRIDKDFGSSTMSIPFLQVSYVDDSFQNGESSVSFDASLRTKHDDYNIDPRLNLSDEGISYASSQHRRRSSRLGSVSSTYNQFTPTRRRQSSFLNDETYIDDSLLRIQRLRSRSWSPMRQFDSSRPRSHSVGDTIYARRHSYRREKGHRGRLNSTVGFADGSIDNTIAESYPENHRKLPTNRFLDRESHRDQASLIRDTTVESVLTRDKANRMPPKVLPKPAWHKDRKSVENSSSKEKIVPRSDIRSRSEADSWRKEMSMLREECASLERQLKNKDTIMRTMKAELKEEVENIALLEKKEKTIQEKAQSNAYLTQELQRCQKELESRNSEISRKDYEINQLKTEVKNLHIAKKHVEQSYTEVQVQVNQTEVVEKKLIEVQEQHDNVLLKNRELIDRIKHLEVAEKEFIELERNVIELQEQLRDMENIEAHRDELYDKFQHLKRQRDDFMEKGRMVEEERNDFLRTNQTMEQRLEEFKKKYILSKKTTGELNRKILILEREKKELESKILDVQNDRNIMQTALGKLEVERDDLIREVKEVTSERYILEQKLAEMDDMLSDHDHLEEGFHSLRLKLGEITRQRDDAEMLIPSLKAKIALLKKACREKDETATRYVEELKHAKHEIGTSGTAPKGRNYEPSQPNPRNRRTTSYFTEGKREERYHSRPRKAEYEISDESVLLSEDDQTITEDGSIMLDNRRDADRRSHTTNRTVHVYDHRSRPSDRTKTFRALYDYDPYKSSSSVHPERELRLKEGDYVTVYGEMDIDGYLEAEVDGETGLIPSIYVEESNDENTRRSREVTTRQVATTNGYGVRQRKFVAIYDYDPYSMGRTGRPEQQLSLRKGDVINVIGDIDIDGYYSAEINGRNGLIPSTFVRELGASATSGTSSYGGQKTYETHISRTAEHRSSNAGMRGGSVEIIRDDVVGPPFAPSNLKILRIVSKDSALLTWNMPPIDKFGKSNGAVVTGYKIWVNGKPKQEVKKYLMTKALVSGLNLHDHLEFDIQTVAENGFCSEKCHFNITGAHALRNPVYEEFFMKAVGNYRTFIALFDYDPYKSSPNQNPALELQFSEGDLLKIYDTSRTDGFYQAEVRGKKGLVPSNFIEEIAMPENSYSRSSEMYTSRNGAESYSRAAQSSSTSYGQTTSSQQQQQRGMTSSGLTTSDYEKRSSLSTNGGRKRKMVAVYDYDPLKQSPSKDKSKELNLRKGQYVTVVGDMRPDGFYLGEIEGRQGLVPGDFLEPSKDDDSDSRRVQFASGNDGN